MRNLILTILFLAIASFWSPAFALTVTPARLEISGDPGTTVYSEIEIFNEQETTKTFFISYENFEPSGDSGAPHFMGNNDGLATWIKSENKLITEPGQRTVVPFAVFIPEKTEPGGYFAAVFFGTQESKPEGRREGGQVSIGGKVGVLVLLRVSGEIEEGGGLLEFTTKEKQKFFTSLPISFIYRVNNTGGDRIVPKGEIKIKNTFKLSSATLLANRNGGSILPNSTRKMEILWGQETKKDDNAKSIKETSGFIEKVKGQFNKFFVKVGEQWSEFHLGWYVAELNLVWGMTNQTANASYSFFVVPWQLLLVAFIVISIITFLGRRIVKKYNRFIISQAQTMQSFNSAQNITNNKNE